MVDNKNDKKVLVSGSSGFIAGYLIEFLLEKGYSVVGIDNLSKYGKVKKSYDNHKSFTNHFFDIKDTPKLKELIEDCDYFIAGAAMIGGISYFHTFAYDLIAENERIIASSFDAAIEAFQKKSLQRIIVISSSMVFESSNSYPSKEGDELISPPPMSTYGFQKLSTEFFAKGANLQYGLPYTIVRPFNCIGTGEMRALSDKEIKSGNVKLAMSHVVPDLIQKIYKGQDPLRILGSGNQIRCYTYGEDIARGIVSAMESPKAINNDYNISISEPTTVIELAKIIWNLIQPNKEFKYISDEPYLYDVQKRIPDTEKAFNDFGFKAKTNLKDALKIIIPWVKEQVDLGNI